MTTRRPNLAVVLKHRASAKKRLADYMRRVPPPKYVQAEIAWLLEAIERLCEAVEDGRKDA